MSQLDKCSSRFPAISALACVAALAAPAAASAHGDGNGIGAHEVIIESPTHSCSFTELTAEQASAAVALLREHGIDPEPYLAEVQAGIWHEWLQDVGTFTANHYRLTFGRDAPGIWLAETAADQATLAAAGLAADHHVGRPAHDCPEHDPRDESHDVEPTGERRSRAR